METYLLYILLYPGKQFPLVKKPNVEITILFHRVARQKPKKSYSVIEIDKNNALARLLHDLGPVVICIGIGSIAPALDVHPDRQSRVSGGIRRLENIDKEAVLGHGGRQALVRPYAYRAKLKENYWSARTAYHAGLSFEFLEKKKFI